MPTPTASRAAEHELPNIELQHAMSDNARTPTRTSGQHDGSADAAGDRAALLRQLGARAHQLRATTRAADHYIASDEAESGDTASWLMSCSLDLSRELTADIDGLARSLKEQPDPALGGTVPRLRVIAHQLQAAAKAADHFLDQDNAEFRDTGTWLIATTTALAGKLAAELDDTVASVRKPQDKAKLDKASIEPHDPQFARRVAAATASARAA
jgi:hypothetical protein